VEKMYESLSEQDVALKILYMLIVFFPYYTHM